MVTPRRECAASEAVWNAIRDVFAVDFQRILESSDRSTDALNNLLRLSQFMIAGVAPENDGAVDMFSS
jgi:hypothetical protein